MKRSVIETILGAVVIVVAATFLFFSYKMGNVAQPNGFIVTADFSTIGGLKPGDDVLISGVKVGSVIDVTLQDDTYLARVSMSVDHKLQLPTDTAALISSESLLGGKYLALEPGAEEELIKNGGHINYTQAPQNLEQLLGQFIFSMQTNDEKNGDAQ